MRLANGSRLGPYEILAPLGAGGMGEVYKARDTRLDRSVAIKVLPPQSADNPEARQRFEREARAVSSLNHPHICTLYDVGRQDSTDFLVMEYLEGETLAARLAGGALVVDQALRYAVQIAEALAEAHRHGVSHRDLKPGNIVLTRTGAKLLDFGLAKLHAAGLAAVGMTALPTAADTLTQAGAVLGTVQYMAPEQLEAKEADARSDIFAFGAVLYEMLTGRKAFPGDSAASVIGAIMTASPPPVSAVQPVAPALERIVQECLAKDPDERWQSARDLAGELKWLAEGGSQRTSGSVIPAAADAVSPRLRTRERLAWAVVVLATVAAVTFAVLHFREAPPPAAQPVRFSVYPPEKTTLDTFALSPDGRSLAMAVLSTEGKYSLWLRQLDALEPQFLPGTEDARFPFWSPDSRYIGFFAEGKLKKILATGGPAQTLCDAATPLGAAWNQGGEIVFTPALGGPIYRVSANGGVPAPLFGGQGTPRFASFFPDGRRFLTTVGIADQSGGGIYAGSLDAGLGRRLFPDHSSAAYAPGPAGRNGYVLFVRDGTLMAQPFDPVRLQPAGDLLPLAEHIVVAALNPYYRRFSVSATGVLAYWAGADVTDRQLVWFDREGKRLGVAGEPGKYGNLTLAPDQKKVAVDRAEGGGNSDLWVWDLERGSASRLTFAPGLDRRPVWSPDGDRIAFVSLRDGPAAIYQKAAAGTGSMELLFQSPDGAELMDWSRDGRYMVYRVNSKTGFDLSLVPLTGERKPLPFLHSEFILTDARFSPDGRWLSYISSESGRFEVYVQPVSSVGSGAASQPRAKWQTSTGGGLEPVWRGDGKELFYLALDLRLMAVPITANSAIQAGTPHALFQTSALPTSPGVSRSYDVTSDGRRFLINTTSAEAEQPPITVVLNWQAGLKR